MSLCVGIDPQPTCLGLALSRIEDREPVWAGTLPLRGPGRTLGQHVRASIRKVDEEAARVGLDVTRVAIERPVVHGPRSSLDVLFDSGGIYHLALDACLRKWGHLLLLVFRPKEWVVEARGQGHGNDRKDVTAAWVRMECVEAGWADWQMLGLKESHATDAMAISWAGVKRGGS